MSTTIIESSSSLNDAAAQGPLFLRRDGRAASPSPDSSSSSSSALESAGADSIVAVGPLVDHLKNKQRGEEAEVEDTAPAEAPRRDSQNSSPPHPSLPYAAAAAASSPPRQRPLKFLGTSWWTLPSAPSSSSVVLLGGHLQLSDSSGSNYRPLRNDGNERLDEQRQPFMIQNREGEGRGRAIDGNRSGANLPSPQLPGRDPVDSRASPYSILVLFVVLAVLWPLGYVSFARLQTLTDSTFQPLPGTPSRWAQDAFEAIYSSPSVTPSCSWASNSDTTIIPASRQCGADWSDPLHPPLFIVLRSIDYLGAEGGDTPPLTSTTSSSYPSLIGNSSSPAYKSARKYGEDLRDLLQSHRWSWTASSSPSGNNTGSDAWFQFTDYYTLVDQDLARMARSAFATPDGRMVLISVQYSFPAAPQFQQRPQAPTPLRASSGSVGPSVPLSSKVASSVAKSRRQDRDRIREVIGAIDAFNQNYSLSATNPWFTVHPTGLPWLQSDLSSSARQDVRRMDWLVLPVAYVLLGVALRGSNPAALWIVPALALVTTVSVWSIAMCPVAERVQITQFTPTIMMSLSLGLGIDYAIFLLARYLEIVAKDPLLSGLAPSRTESSVSPPSSRADAIAHMLAQGKKVILLSGSTLICAFLGLCILPLPMLRSVGVGSAVAIFSAIVVNLTLIPAILASPMGGWIVRRQRPAAQGIGDQGRTDQGPLAEAWVDSVATERQLNDIERSSALLPAQPPSVWYWLSSHLLHPYRGIILLLVTLQLLIPIAMYAGKVKSSISFDLFIPRTSPALQAFQMLGEQVGYARLNPVRILFDARFATNNATQSMTSDGGFAVMHHVVDELLSMELSGIRGRTLSSSPSRKSATTPALSGSFPRQTAPTRNLMTCKERISRSPFITSKSRVDAASNLIHCIVSSSTAQDPPELGDEGDVQRFVFGPSRRDHRWEGPVVPRPAQKPSRTVYNGISVLQNTRIPHSVFVAAKLCSQIKPHCPLELLHEINAVDRVSTSPDGGQATYVTATLGVDPFSDEGVAWLLSARRLIDLLEASGELRGVRVHIQGAAAIEYDAQQAVYQSLPWMALITTVAVFLLMGIFFRSVFLPLRSVVSIGLTLTFTFGLGVLVYEKGIAKWTGIRALSTLHHEFCWLAPVMAFSLIVGLALDYDVFLVSRVLEYRLDGYEHKSAIAAALHSTGGIITAAGVIMSVAFGSLLFSPSPVLCQWSFLVTTAVLFDTFLVRTIVVPIVTSLAGGCCCFWPRAMPEPRVTMPEFLGGMDDVSGLLRTLERSSEYESLHQGAVFASRRH